MSSRQEIVDKLTPVFCDVFDEDVVLRDDLTADDVEQWDSVSHIRLVLAVERAFGVQLTTAEVDNLDNVGDLIGLLEKKTN